MFFDFGELSRHNCHKLMTSTIVPRPIAWVSTLNADGSVNVGPFSFFNIVSEDPPLVSIGVGSGERFQGDRKDTGVNIRRSGEFVVSLVAYVNADAMVMTAVNLPAGRSELEFAGLETMPSARIAVPRIRQSPVSLECRLFQSIDIGDGQSLVLGRVVGAHVDDGAVLDAGRCYIDTRKLDLIARMHGNGWYTRMTDWFQRVTPRAN
ncbi:flavin reductase family protein [Mesorhizobium sp. LHD-90]|uniref:flavin reductase family protein n=1 Tax=Mesorhizobium sp. LHD-90 TaxID=3071414 RepID=UPI0027E11052|nr:flavin reductase family protein [Mesorhizobium sp. LHD-90]MDQ6432526.1 flavin reductase family protein [Mesorhizobium sp. LHD-90]